MKNALHSNWFKKAQALSTDSFEPHPRIAELKRHLSADDEDGNNISIIVAPVVSGGREYVTIQLDAAHGGSVPKSAALSRLYEALVKTNTGLKPASFIDDHFSEEEAKLPSGSYKASSMELVLGPSEYGAIAAAIDALCETWKSECSKMVNLDLISIYSISDSRYRSLSQGESSQSSEAFDKIFTNDVAQTRMFLCRLFRFSKAHGELKKWIDELYENVTDWTWRGIHIKPFPGYRDGEVDCSRAPSTEWVERFSSNMDSPVLEIFKHVNGEAVPNFEDVIDIAQSMPSDAGSRRGIEAFIGYASKDGEEEYIRSWMRNAAKDKSMFSMSILSHPWAVTALRKRYPELAERLQAMQKGAL